LSVQFSLSQPSSFDQLRSPGSQPPAAAIFAGGGGQRSPSGAKQADVDTPAPEIKTTQVSVNPPQKSRPLYLFNPLQTSVHRRPFKPIINSLSSKLSRRHGRRETIIKFSDRVKSFNPRLAMRIRKCGEHVKWRETDCIHRKIGRIFQDRFCMFRLCPSCINRLAIRMMKFFAPALKKYIDAQGLYAYFVTLTLRDTEHLPDKQSLRLWLKNMMRSEFWLSYGLHGFFRACEVKIGSGSGRFHLHYHFLILTEMPIDTIQFGQREHHAEIYINQALSDTWSQITSGSGSIVDIKDFDGNYNELMKYVTKSAGEMNDTQLKEFCTWSYNYRFYAFGGKLYNNLQLRRAIKEAHQLDNEDDVEDLVCEVCGCCDNVDRSARWNYDLKRFVEGRRYEQIQATTNYSARTSADPRAGP
jgi:hypothetical protein